MSCVFGGRTLLNWLRDGDERMRLERFEDQVSYFIGSLRQKEG